MAKSKFQKDVETLLGREVTPAQIARALASGIEQQEEEKPSGRLQRTGGKKLSGRKARSKKQPATATKFQVVDGTREGYVEVIFRDDAGNPAKPGDDVLEALKSAGYRFSVSGGREPRWWGPLAALPEDFQ